jgi:serine phosphatase RsbU (regulator of sigma subunit)
VDAVDADLAGPPLGLVEGYAYPPAEISLQLGDSLLLYTDGVTDSLNTQNKAFALKGIRDALLDDSAVGSGLCRPDMIGGRLLEGVRRHAAGKAQNDDIAVVCFGRLDPSASSTGPPPIVG